MYANYKTICTLLLHCTLCTLQCRAFHPDSSFGAQTNTRHDVNLKRRVGYHPAPLQQFADKDAALYLGEGVANTRARAVAKGHVATARRGTITGAAAREALRVKDRRVRPDTRVSECMEKERQ